MLIAASKKKRKSEQKLIVRIDEESFPDLLLRDTFSSTSRDTSHQMKWQGGGKVKCMNICHLILFTNIFTSITQNS